MSQKNPNLPPNHDNAYRPPLYDVRKQPVVETTVKTTQPVNVSDDKTAGARWGGYGHGRGWGGYGRGYGYGGYPVVYGGGYPGYCTDPNGYLYRC